MRLKVRGKHQKNSRMKRGKRHGLDPNDYTFMYIVLDEFRKYIHVHSPMTKPLELCFLSHREVGLEQVLAILHAAVSLYHFVSVLWGHN